MHTLHYIATKAETADEAYQNVDNYLESEMGYGDTPSSWYDWYVVGGGRWNTEGSDDFQEAYKAGKTNMIVSTDNLVEFTNILHGCVESRLSEFRRQREEWNQRGVNLDEALDNYTGNTDYSFKLSPLGSMIRMLQGEWYYDSYFYDMENFSTNQEHMLRDIKDVGGVWYLVPVDFHF